MSPALYPKALTAAVAAARASGELMRKHLNAPKKINASTPHDIKLELDVRSQKLIQKILKKSFPEIAMLGEEGIVGDINAEYRWVVDPIDGTVNFAHGLPHACVSIALQRQLPSLSKAKALISGDHFKTVIGVVYDPFCNELWTATARGPARLNGKPIHVSRRTRLQELIVSIGFAKHRKTVEATLPALKALIPRVRKIRIMGSAALALVYVATGRFDAYIESGINLWDIAAGGLILERAGGEFWNRPLPQPFRYRILSNNGKVRRPLTRVLKGLFL